MFHFVSVMRLEPAASEANEANRKVLDGITLLVRGVLPGANRSGTPEENTRFHSG
jgi:hypothetical protein